MKTNIKSLMFLTALAMTLAACTDAFEETAIVLPDENLVELTISTGRPDAADTRTMVAEDGVTPMWCVSDAIGVSVLSGSSYTNHEFTNDNTESASRKTTFSGKTAVGDLLYSYYPYSEAGVNTEGKVQMTIPAVQHPTATSFDGAADILVGKPVVMTPATTKIEGLQFKRVGGFLKIVLKDATSGKIITGETVESVSVTAENNLAGSAYLDIVNGELGEIYANEAAKVTAKHNSDTEYKIGDETAAYIGVYPQILTEGSTITISAKTASYDIEREIALPYEIDIKEGQITTLNVNIGDENLSEKTIDINEAFPDPIFRQYVSDNFDTDHDGKLSKDEILAVEYIDVAFSYKPDEEKIASLEGIQYFPNLTYLNCGYNKLTTLDVSKNTALTRLNCGENQLTSLNVSKNTALIGLWCFDNQLTTLDLSKNIRLYGLYCYENQLTTLDLSKGPAFHYLDCGYNQLATLNVSGCSALTELYCYSNQLTALDLSQNTALTDLNCHSNQLTTLDVSNTALTYLRCEDNQLTTLDVSQNTELITLSCWSNQLTTLDLSKNIRLYSLYCNDNQLTTLDVSKNTALTYLSCYNNQLTTLDVSNTNLGNSTNNYPLDCAPMETLTMLYLKTGWEINGINTNRDSNYIPEQTKIVFISGDYGEGGDSGGEIGDGGEYEI